VDSAVQGLLALDPSTLESRMKKLGIDRNDV
jgi:hypothetical protein